MSSILETFREILAQHDLLPEDILADGNLLSLSDTEQTVQAQRRIYCPSGQARDSLVVQLGNRRSGDVPRGRRTGTFSC